MQVVDPKLASYSTDNPIFSLTDAIIAASRRQVAQNTFDLPFNKIEALNNRILVSLVSSIGFFFNFYFPFQI